VTDTGLIAGVDEAGRGPLAGPVVAAAVILDPSRPIAGLGDSKRLSEKRREALYPQIIELALAHCIVFVERIEIDRINIFQATMQGMVRAVSGLDPAPGHALIDGNRVPQGLPCPAEAIVGGDGSEAAIGAASILAKVARDRYMVALEQRFPGYGFARHKGYGTRDHQQAIRELGPSPVHRRSFPVLRELRGECSAPFYALRARIADATTAAVLRGAEAELETRRDDLAEAEQRKLRTLLQRRWRGIAP
jgi:ribonuclease HII